jgi:hypothetical protein
MDGNDPMPARRRGDLDVPVAPVGGGRRRQSRGPLALAGLLVVLAVGAIVLARLFPAAPVGPAVVLPTSDASIVAPSIAESTKAPLLASPPRLRTEELVAGVRNGSLDGRLVYADATLRAWCHPERLDDCDLPHVAVDGLPLDVVASTSARGAIGGIPDDAVLVLAVRDGRLVYLGSLVVHADGSPSLGELDSGAGERAGLVRPSLEDASGWLVIKPACISTTPSASPSCDRPPFIADDEPLEGGILRSDRGQTVVLSPSVWGVDPAVDTVSAGPFLVQHMDRPGGPSPEAWEVIARYDPARSVRIVIP